MERAAKALSNPALVDAERRRRERALDREAHQNNLRDYMQWRGYRNSGTAAAGFGETAAEQDRRRLGRDEALRPIDRVTDCYDKRRAAARARQKTVQAGLRPNPMGALLRTRPNASLPSLAREPEKKSCSVPTLAPAYDDDASDGRRSPIRDRADQLRKRHTAQRAKLDAAGIFSSAANHVRCSSILHSKVHKMVLEEEHASAHRLARTSTGLLTAADRRRAERRLAEGAMQDESDDDSPDEREHEVRLPAIGRARPKKGKGMANSKSAPGRLLPARDAPRDEGGGEKLPRVFDRQLTGI
jgi:hypothetical protein